MVLDPTASPFRGRPSRVPLAERIGAPPRGAQDEVPAKSRVPAGVFLLTRSFHLRQGQGRSRRRFFSPIGVFLHSFFPSGCPGSRFLRRTTCFRLPAPTPASTFGPSWTATRSMVRTPVFTEAKQEAFRRSAFRGFATESTKTTQLGLVRAERLEGHVKCQSRTANRQSLFGPVGAEADAAVVVWDRAPAVMQVLALAERKGILVHVIDEPARRKV